MFMFVHMYITDTDAVHTVKKSASPLSTAEIPGVTLQVCVCVEGDSGESFTPTFSSLLSAQQYACRPLTYHLAVCTRSLTWLVGVFPSGVEASPEGSQGELYSVLSQGPLRCHFSLQ